MRTEEDWVRNASVVRVVDGDTLKLAVDMGGYITWDMTARLDGLNAPEVTGPDKAKGIAARDWLADQVYNKDVVGEVVIRIRKVTEKYGRWLVTVWAGDMNINEGLIAAGHAVRWDGKGQKP